MRNTTNKSVNIIKSCGKFLFILFFYVLGQTSLAQESVTGTVFDVNGVPLLGVTIIEKNTSNGTITDLDGNFEIGIKNDAILVFSFIGFKKKELPVMSGQNFNVVLNEDAESLSEIVVVGYGNQNRKTLTSRVESVQAEEIVDIPAASVDQMLQGRVSGVQISSTSGDPGGGISVRIRGTSSISGSSDPLYVVDGIPIQSSTLGQIGVGGATTNPIADINPSDIESISILKDASATAIYGSRAANGVVLITTKRGTRDQTKISLGIYRGVQNLIKRPSLVTGEQFEVLRNESARNNGNMELFPNPENAINTRWNDLVLNENAPIRNIDASVRGGNEKVRYFISATNFMQEGPVRNSDYNRNTGRVNLDFAVNKKLDMGTSVLYSRTNRGIVPNSDNIAGAFAGSFFYPSNLPVFQDDGTYNRIPTIDHPLATVDQTDIGMETGRFLGTIYAEYSFLPGLRLKSTFSVDYTDNSESSYRNTFTNAGSALQGIALIFNVNNNNWIQENVLSYQFYKNKSSFNVLLGTTVQESETKIARSQGTGFPTNDFTQINSAAVLDAGSSSTSYGIASLFSRINYDYNEKYLVTLNIRGDGSSRFGSDNRWGIFPAVGLGWVISEENFLKDVSFISNLKLLGGYGITGNQSGITDFNSLGLWQGASYAAVPGVRPFQLENPDLKWETTKQTDIGLEMSLFDDRVSFNAGYYYKKTEDLLLEVPLPRTSGFVSVAQNSGEIENKGLEVGLGVNVFSASNELQWYINGNVAGNRNKILKLVAPFNVYNRDLFRYEEGFPMFSFYMHNQIGVDQQTGEIQFEDVNGDGEFTTSADRKIVGNANPDFFGGLTNTLNYKGFDLSFLFQFSYGNDQLNLTRFFMEHGGTRGTNFSGSQLNRWQNPGDITEVPRMNSANYAGDLRPSRFVEDASYLRLKNISLGYTIPENISKMIYLSSARFYISGQNILTFTNYSGLDPELTGTASNNLTQGVEFFTAPSPRVLTAGCNLSF
jgi:TonB-linked SusC/RagA family outer membrane protein